MRRFGLLALMLVFASAAWSEPAFRAGSLVGVPTAETLPGGRFVASVAGAYELEEPFHRASTGLAIDFGVVSSLQGGLSWREERNAEHSKLLWNVRLRLMREVAGRPGVAVGVIGLGEGKGSRASTLVLSKALNLPHVGFFDVHVGVRHALDPSFADGETDPIGGVEKWWRNRTVRLSGEWDGDAFNVGALARLGGGLRLGVAVDTHTPRLLFAVGFGNGELLDEIEDAERLAKQAARLATAGDGE